jgi:membrane-associated phospholipid phosphatase
MIEPALVVAPERAPLRRGLRARLRRAVCRRVRPEEALLALYAVALLAIMAATGNWIFTTTLHRHFLTVFVALALLVFARSWRRARLAGTAAPARRALGPALRVVRDFAPFFIGLVFYETMHDLTPRLRPHVVDAQLIAMDRALFGCDAAVALGRLATPSLTQAMVFCYLSYFFAPGLLAAVLYWYERRRAFRDFLVSLAVVTLIGYTGYLLVPAVGPFVFQAELFPTRLPGGGLKVTEQVIATIDGLKGWARDCFPSLHTAHTTVVLAFARRGAPRFFWAYLPIGLGLYFSTIYLRMHYVVDVAAGFAAAAAAVAIGPRLERWWYREEVSTSR